MIQRFFSQEDYKESFIDLITRLENLMKLNCNEKLMDSSPNTPGQTESGESTQLELALPISIGCTSATTITDKTASAESPHSSDNKDILSSGTESLQQNISSADWSPQLYIYSN